jgi:hypothetical protein
MSDQDRGRGRLVGRIPAARSARREAKEVQLACLVVGRDPMLEEALEEETIPVGEGAGDG